MAKYRKLGKTSDQRKALLRNQVTNLLYHGKIVTTEARAKEVRKIAEGIIAMGVREKDNFETVKVTAKVARKDKDGKRVKETVDGKKVTVYDEVEKEIKKDLPSRLHARRQMFPPLQPDVKEAPRRLICLPRFLMKSLLSMWIVRVDIPVSSRSDREKVTEQWKLFWSWYKIKIRKQYCFSV